MTATSVSLNDKAVEAMTADTKNARAAEARGRDGVPLKIVVVGHVDHGKSTLVGRLMHDTGCLPDGRIEAVRAMSERRGMPFEWAFLMDALKAERDQGVTIDTSQIHFRTGKRSYVLIDAPGHHEFIKNMVTGASSADAAVLVVDAVEGIREQTRRHGYLLRLLGIREVVVAMNKMDMAAYSEARYRRVADDCRGYLNEIGATAERIRVIPISARKGDNVANRSDAMTWYDGPTLIEGLDAFDYPRLPVDQALRLPVQDVYKFDDRRIIVGRVESGRLNVGDEIVFSPSNKKARVEAIEDWPAGGPPPAARAGRSVGIRLDHQIFVERGEVVSHAASMPMLGNVFRARIFWLGKTPLRVGSRYKLKLNTAECPVTVRAIENVIDVADMGGVKADRVERNMVGEIVLRAKSVIALDPFGNNARTGRFVIVSDYDIVGGGLVSMDGCPDQRDRLKIKSENLTRVEHRVERSARWQSQGHKSGVVWLTGLSASGKSTLAFALEKILFDKGYQTYVLDGDNVRHGLGADLGFSPEDRAENIRRVAETARLMADSGVIVITAFISPYRADRDLARAVNGELFHEIHVRADIQACEARDPKGLYKKARAGRIKEFTGVTAPYEPPEAPEMVIDTTSVPVEESLEMLMDYVLENFTFSSTAQWNDYSI